MNSPTTSYQIGHQEEEELEEEISIYPNPSEIIGTLKIMIPGEINNASIEMFNHLGIVVRSFKTSSNLSYMNVEGLSSGLYIININNNKKKIIQRRVKLE